jgi:uncharacterized protein YndB with AHSA1/START domain
MTDGINSQQAVLIERIFDAPVNLIWQTWTDPEHFKAWYGPAGATIPIAKRHCCVGGAHDGERAGVFLAFDQMASTSWSNAAAARR